MILVATLESANYSNSFVLSLNSSHGFIMSNTVELNIIMRTLHKTDVPIQEHSKTG